jgi:hypothetical protein
MPYVNTDKPLSSRVFSKFLQHCMRCGENECWIWTGPIHKVTGYGVFEVYNIEYKAHRVSFFYFNHRTVESEFDILHTCDNRRCCNPKHLYEGDNADNNRDRDERNPGATINRGTDNGEAKLTETDIPEIFRLRRKGYTQQQIADEYGVVFSTIGKVLRREKWRHVKIN